MSMLLRPVIGPCLRGASALSLRRQIHSQSHQPRQYSLLKPLLWAGSALAAATALTLHSSVYLDADIHSEPETIVDPATSIAFPKTLRIPSKTPLPTFSLVGVGVRTVSFLGIKVYSVGFYADLANPDLKIPKTASPEENIEYIVRNTACVLRIVPTRSTSYSHLRDGFIRALQARMQFCRQRGRLTAEEEAGAQSSLRKFKTLFPNTPLAKHSPLDILLTPRPSNPAEHRLLIVRDLGAIQNNWLAQEFILTYFEGDGLSPPLKRAVVSSLQAEMGL